MLSGFASSVSPHQPAHLFVLSARLISSSHQSAHYFGSIREFLFLARRLLVLVSRFCLVNSLLLQFLSCSGDVQPQSLLLKKSNLFRLKKHFEQSFLAPPKLPISAVLPATYCLLPPAAYCNPHYREGNLVMIVARST